MTASPFIDAWLTGPGDVRFYTRTYTPSDTPVAVLVFAHGAAEHCGRYTHFHGSLSTDHAIAVFAYDQRGFGRTALDAQNRTPGAMYGKTTWADQLEDLEWAIQTARNAFHDVPVCLMGCSMGGGIVLGYMARQNRPSETDTLISGVIAGSPCIKLTREPPKALLWVAHQIARIHPYMQYPLRNKSEDLSRNEETNAAYDADPLVGVPGSLRSLEDMITEGGRLLTNNYVHWPEDVSVLFLHGTADQVTSPVAAQQLYDKLPAKRKKMITYPGARHELHNEPDGVREQSLSAIVDFIKTVTGGSQSK